MEQLRISGLEIDPVTSMPLVVLEIVSRGRYFPLWIGLFEANSIALELEKIKTPRPMTHDLLKNVIVAMEGTVSRVALVELRKHTFYAVVYLLKDGKEIAIDSRPSDAFSLALRWDAPILVSESVLETCPTFGSVDEMRKSRKDHEA